VDSKSIEILKNADKFNDSISYVNKYTDFSYTSRKILKQNYLKIQGIYLFVNNLNNRSYVGKSVNLYIRFSKYFSINYLEKNKTKMAICAALLKYSINNFSLYILEIVEDKNNLSER
jgi:hypothetical protein